MLSPGFVSLVGAGPGDAELLTLAALKAIQAAEVILYDALIDPSIRALFPASAKSVYVGKRCGQHALRQVQINERLVAFAKEGYRVLRLKGGDPLIFGRGGEELEALRSAGVPYRVIPGISALNGLAAACGLPLTDRRGSNELRAIQGHFLREDPRYWRELARYEGTLIIYMGLERLPEIARRLQDHGAPLSRPLAVIETSEDGERHLSRSTLAEIAREGFQKKTSGPGLIYIGCNVQLMDFPSSSHQEETPHAYALAHFS